MKKNKQRVWKHLVEYGDRMEKTFRRDTKDYLLKTFLRIPEQASQLICAIDYHVASRRPK